VRVGFLWKVRADWVGVVGFERVVWELGGGGHGGVGERCSLWVVIILPIYYPPAPHCSPPPFYPQVLGHPPCRQNHPSTLPFDYLAPLRRRPRTLHLRLCREPPRSPLITL